jgi:hypothetical protein
MLNSRIIILKNYLEAVKSGELKADPSVLRDIKAICQQLPAIDSTAFKVEFLSVRSVLVLSNLERNTTMLCCLPTWPP